MPYPECTQEQKLIIATLCPVSVDYKEYKRTQIPLRVLQVIAHAQENEYFNQILILDKRTESIKDPFVIGLRGKEKYSQTPHLLARWGDELESWSILRKKVKEIIMEQKKLYKKKIARLIDDSLDNDGEVILPSFSLPTIGTWGVSGGFNSEPF